MLIITVIMKISIFTFIFISYLAHSKICQEKYHFYKEKIDKAPKVRKFIKSIRKYPVLLVGEQHSFRIHYPSVFETDKKT